MSTTSANVRSLSTINKQIPEVKSLMDAVSKVSWDLRVPLISQTLGLGYSIDSRLLNKALDLPRGSVGRQMGFTTLGEVIATPASNGGLEISWADWESDIKAYNYKKTFGIYYQTQSEVIKEYSSVCEALGHNPVTLHEFSKTRDEIMIRNNHRRERQISEKADEYKRNYESEIEDRKNIESRYASISEELKSLKSQYEALGEEYRSEMSLLMSANEIQVKQAKEEGIEQASSDYKSRLIKLRREITGLEGDLSEALKKISQIETSSEEMDKVINSLKADIKEKSKELQTAEDTIARQEEVIARYEQMIDDLEIRIQEISTQNGITQMEVMLDKSRDRLIRLSCKYKASNDSRIDLKARVDRNRQRISMLKSDLRDRKLEIKRKNIEIQKREKAISSHKAVRNFLVVTTLSSLGLLTGLSYLVL